MTIHRARLPLIIASLLLMAPAVRTYAQSSFSRLEHSLLEMEPVQGTKIPDEATTINGRVFKNALEMGTNYDETGTVVFANKGDNDLFEAWIGKKGGSGKGTVTFEVLGDGKSLYRSPEMDIASPAIRVSVAIKGYTGITLKVDQPEDSDGVYPAIWAEPMFIKLVQRTVTPPPVFNPPPTASHNVWPSQRTAGITVLVDGRPIQFARTPPVRLAGRVLVPMREIFESLGARVNWNPAQQAINALQRQTSIQMQIGSFAAVVNGRRITLDQPPVLCQGATMVPLRFVSEALGAQVAWNEYQHTVLINSGQAGR